MKARYGKSGSVEGRAKFVRHNGALLHRGTALELRRRISFAIPGSSLHQEGFVRSGVLCLPI